MGQDIFDTVGSQQQPGAAATATPSPSGSSTPPSGAATPGQGDIFDTVPEQQQTDTPQFDPSGQIKIGADDNLLTKGAKGLAAVGAGAGKGILDTMASGAHMLGMSHTEDLLNQRRAELDYDNADNPILKSIGYGGETLAEFMLGDEALKGLSMADKMTEVAKTMKVLQGSPKLMEALKTGASIGKAATSLSPEELALVKKYPVVGRLVHAGMEATRGSLVQGGQTLLRTRDPGQATKDAVTAGIVQGGVGGALGVVGGKLAQAGDAADTVAGMNRVAETAPTGQAVSDQLGKAVDSAVAPDRTAAEVELHQATSDMGGFARGAPSNSTLTDSAQQMAKQSDRDMHTRYNAAGNTVRDLTRNQVLPYEGSPIQAAARSALGIGEADTGPLDEAIRKTLPGSSKVNDMLENLANLGQPEEAEAPREMTAVERARASFGQTDPAAAQPEAEQPVDLNVPYLMKLYKTLGDRYRSIGYGSETERADKQIYSNLRQSVHDTIGQIAEQSGNPDAIDVFKNMNKDYKENVKLFQNKDMQSLMAGNVNDVDARLLRGETSLDDINTVHKALGDTNFHQLGVDSLQRLAADSVDQQGNLDYAGLAKKWNRINVDSRNALYGQFSADTFSRALDAATGASGRLKVANDTVAGLLGKGNIETLMSNPDKLRETAALVGPDAMKQIGQSLMESKISEASTSLDPKTGKVVKGAFNPDKVLDFWMSMKDSPEIRNTLFTPDAASIKKYDNLMSKLHEASSVKKLVKYGVLPLTFGTAGLVHGPGAALIAAIAGGGVEATFGHARDILDKMANSPAMWKFLAGSNKLAQTPTAAVLNRAGQAKAAQVVSPTARKVYNGLGHLLGAK